MARKTVEIFKDRDFGIVYDTDEKPHTLDFQFHNHDDLYEVVLLHEGDCEFCVEGNAYRLEPHDIIFTRPFEMHKMMFLSQRTYRRTILYIRSDFFKKNDCESFVGIFENRQLGTGNRIPHNIADSVLNDCIGRIYAYSEEKAYDIAQNCVFEFLYLINKCKNISGEEYVKDERVRNIIIYINNHLSDDLSLDILAKKFFLAKSYMCRMFKNHTGHTINKYITYKRIILAQELHKSGQNLLQASLNAGFNSYTNFYKAYVNQTGEPPRKMQNKNRTVVY